MFPGFEERDINVNGITLHATMGGNGPPLLLLHGYPQTHVMWHKIAPRLAEVFTVVAPDLRGYGDSSRPTSSADHAAYSKRAMAADQVELMRTLGFDRFAVVGHDRGARVGHRMALDHPAAVSALALLDIVPTRHVYDHVDRDLAYSYYHWFFLTRPVPLPERLIGAEPEFFLRTLLESWSAGGSLDPFDPAAVAEYARCFSDPESIHATCEDYRAGSSIDLEHDAVDAKAGHLITCPTLVLWGNRSFVGQHYGVAEIWSRYASDLRGAGVDSGHFPAEEAPEETFAELQAFLTDALR